MSPRVSLSALFRSVRRILGGVLLAVAILVGSGGAVVAQAGREEATRADTAILMLDGAGDGEAARIDRGVRLYLGGEISRIVLAGSDPAPARDALVARGVLQDKISEVRQPTQIGQLREVQRLLEDTRVIDVILISEPVEALRLLKIARDHGIALHSLPTGAGGAINLRQVVDEVGRYLAYCFVGR